MNFSAFEKSGSDVRERLTLHVKKRQVEDIPEDRKSDDTQGVTASEPELEQVRKKILKKTRKKKMIGSKQGKKKFKVKSEYIYDQDTQVATDCGVDNGVECGMETNYESEDVSACDDMNQDMMQPVPMSNTSGDSFANNCILNEILSEKKRALLESADMIEFLQSRIRTS